MDEGRLEDGDKIRLWVLQGRSVNCSAKSMWYSDSNPHVCLIWAGGSVAQAVRSVCVWICHLGLDM